MFPVAQTGFTIPVGDDSYTRKWYLQWPLDIKTFETFPYMHVLRCVARAKHYELDNQLTYFLKKPLVVDWGPSLEWSFTWNHSEASPRLIYDWPDKANYGERTNQPRNALFLSASQPTFAALGALLCQWGVVLLGV